MIGELLGHLAAITDLAGLAFASGTLLVAYTIFGLTGFGSSIIAIPFLIQVLPLHTCVAVMLLFDLIVCSLLNFKERHIADKVELKRILPSLLVGAIGGILLSLHAPKKPLFLLLGAFVIAMFVWSNFFNKKSYRISSAFAPPLAFFGGAFTTLFGTGGPLYTIYLAGRIDEKRILRATLGALIGMTAIIRLVMFSAGGLMSAPAIYLIAVILFPFALTGFLLGSLLHKKLDSRAVKKAVWIILLIGGISAFVKGI
ncbi:MAG: sulfite exporter TauE/SafE family protein [Candidimonas sp.]|nr:MAG: sulfite exporter TauE/SafE family protein [Candidimonas sp.]